MDSPLRISASGLSLFNDCKLCFWLKFKKGIKRPEFPVATIANGLDRVIKEYMNRYRPKGEIPPFLKRKIPGRLIKFLPRELSTIYNGVTLVGRLDECLVLKNGIHIALDHKTKGFEVREVHKSHQLQMDFYTYLLKRNNYKTGSAAYLVHYIPTFGELHNGIPFKIDVRRLVVHPNRIPRLISEVRSLLNNGSPKAAKDCEFCGFVKNRIK